MTDRMDVIDEQLDFVTQCSNLRELGEMVDADTKMSLNEKVDYIKKHINEFCNKWNLIHELKEK